MHGPNMVDTLRCNQCEMLGHAAGQCSLYSGLSIRLLFKEPVSYHALGQLRVTSTARMGYLGSSAEERKPSRRVTLTFSQLGDQSEADHAGQVAAAIKQIMPTIRSLLHTLPAVVQAKDRLRECQECGSMQYPHECAFMPSGVSHRASLDGVQHRPAAMQSSGASAGRPDQSDAMCRMWRSKKTCPRRDEGRPCKHEHPPGHVPDGCYQFAKMGHCNRGDQCAYPHTRAPMMDARTETVVEVPAAAAAAAAAADAAVSSPASSSQPANPAAPAKSKQKKRGAATVEPIIATDPEPSGRPSQIDQPCTPQRQSSSAENEASATPSKKQRTGAAARQATPAATRTTSAFGILPTVTALTRWADVEDECDTPPSTSTASRASSVTAVGALSSSLGSLSSPAKPARAKKPAEQQQKAAASPAAPTRR